MQRGQDQVARQAASTLILAVSLSRISPIITMSGRRAGCSSGLRRRSGRPLVDLHLVEAWYLVLDGVLDGYDVLLRGVQLLEGGVERRGLARAGRPRNQGGPVRPAEDGLETLVVPLLEAQFPRSTSTLAVSSSLSTTFSP